MKIKTLNILLAILLAFASFVFRSPQPVSAAPNSAELIAEINSLRASNGLPALRVDPYLTASAQSHSQYQASIGSWTHTGPGGSTYTSRAIAAGYGGGAGVYVRENVAMTTSSGTTNYIVYTLWADAVHWNTMLNASVTDIGVGVAESNGWYYYTMDVGAVTGQSGAATVVPTTPAGGGSPVTQPTSNLISPIITSTTAPDGSVIHEVQNGQALWGVAVAYNTTADAIKKLNGLTSDIIYTGQKLVILPSFTPTLSPTATETPLPPTRTPTPTVTPRTPTVTLTPSLTPTSTPAPLISLEGLDKRTLGITIIAVSGAGLLFIILGMLLKRKKA